MVSKRFWALLAALSLSCSFYACTDDKDDDDPSDVNDNIDVDSGISETKSALSSCDFAKASVSYESIYASAAKSSDKMTAEIALNRSFLGLINLVHDEDLQAVLPKFGFESGSIDFSYFWNTKDGIFAQMITDDKDFDPILDKFNHPTYNGDKDFFEAIDKNYTLGELIQVFVSLEPKFNSLADSFEKAASLMTKDQYLTIADAGCSLNEIEFSSADLYMFAGLLRLTSSFIDLAGAYDGSMTVHDFIKVIIDDWDDGKCYDEETEEACNAVCNAFKAKLDGVIKFVSNVKGVSDDGRASFVSAIRLLNLAVSVSSDAPIESFFGWNRFKAGSVADVAALAAGAGEDSFTLTKDLVGKDIVIDLKKVFDKPTAFTGAVSGCDMDISGNYASIDDIYIDPNGMFENYLNAVSGSSIFEYDEEYEDYDISDVYDSSFSSAWEEFSVNFFLNPHGYFGGYDTPEMRMICDPDEYKSSCRGNALSYCYVDGDEEGRVGYLLCDEDSYSGEAKCVTKDGKAICDECDPNEKVDIPSECVNDVYVTYSCSKYGVIGSDNHYCEKGCDEETGRCVQECEPSKDLIYECVDDYRSYLQVYKCNDLGMKEYIEYTQCNSCDDSGCHDCEPGSSGKICDDGSSLSYTCTEYGTYKFNYDFDSYCEYGCDKKTGECKEAEKCDPNGGNIVECEDSTLSIYYCSDDGYKKPIDEYECNSCGEGVCLDCEPHTDIYRCSANNTSSINYYCSSYGTLEKYSGNYEECSGGCDETTGRCIEEEEPVQDVVTECSGSTLTVYYCDEDGCNYSDGQMFDCNNCGDGVCNDCEPYTDGYRCSEDNAFSFDYYCTEYGVIEQHNTEYCDNGCDETTGKCSSECDPSQGEWIVCAEGTLIVNECDEYGEIQVLNYYPCNNCGDGVCNDCEPGTTEWSCSYGSYADDISSERYDCSEYGTESMAPSSSESCEKGCNEETGKCIE